MVWNLWQIEDNLRTYLTRSSSQKTIKTLPARTKNFKSSFFPHCAEAWGNRSEELRNIDSIKTFKSSILNFGRPRENSVFAVHDINGVKLLSILRLDCSHLNENKFQHNFNDIVNPMCSCGKEPETSVHYLLRCGLYSIYWLELLNDICALNKSLKNFFLVFFSYQVFSIWYFFHVFYVKSVYRIYIKRYMSYVSFLSCVVLFCYFYYQYPCN